MLQTEREYSNKFGGVEALYVVHNHDLAGGKWEKANDALHWHAGRLRILADCGYLGKPVRTYYNGEVSEKPVKIKYYPYLYFRPVEFFLKQHTLVEVQS
jgi:hypothetical protein